MESHLSHCPDFSEPQSSHLANGFITPMRCTQAVYLEGLTRPLGPCLCLTRLMEMHFREDPWYNLSKVSGAWESRACPASLCDLRLVPAPL